MMTFFSFNTFVFSFFFNFIFFIPRISITNLYNSVSFLFVKSVNLFDNTRSLDRYQLNLPDPATPIAFGIHSLHNHILFFLCVIFAAVFFLLLSILYHFSFYNDKIYILNKYLFFIPNFILSRLFFFCLYCSRRILMLFEFPMFDPIFGPRISRFSYYVWKIFVGPFTVIIAVIVSGFFSLWEGKKFELRVYKDAKTHMTAPVVLYADIMRFLKRWYHWCIQAHIWTLLSRFNSSKTFVYILDENGSDRFVQFWGVSTANCFKFLQTPLAFTIDWLQFRQERVNKLKWLTYLISNRQYRVTHNLNLEVIWTVIPTLILIIIAIPSFALLYSMDELLEPSVTVKIIGHQWYWSYEYSDLRPLVGGESIAFDSYMVPDSDLSIGDLRLLKTDCPLILPKETNIRFLITSTDVLHSWAVPSFGIKMDAVPGRLNQTSAFVMECGRYYGQCSELCGVNHAFMPIEICVVEPADYYNWLLLKRS
uniref:Cytochrome c oxidase subunit 2 n=1 Tax=Balamuthia mandrillaris TaxID=66527 RepID=A0A0K1HP75_9EUKA|nr:cytochrome c oxidase subunit 2 [Balamuthia mandrillaris]